MFQPEKFERAASEIDAIVAFCNSPVRDVLDLGCGPGRHAVPLALAGKRVTGVDLSPHLLAQARAYAEAHEARAEWVQADMREFRSPGDFDLIVSMWTSFGYFDDPEDDREVLGLCLENLRPGGTLLVDIAGKEYMARNIEPVHLTELDDESLLIERPTLEDRMCRYSNEWLLIEGDRVHRAHWHHNLYSARELADLLSDAGFEPPLIYGDLEGNPYDLDAERLIAVARKP
ncbi:MAG: methyltransferase domain-containing protein [Xanthomonadales bacterium]|nr:methyltransferase domain-containing protein [Xanthomonadales bacterium]